MKITLRMPKFRRPPPLSLTQRQAALGLLGFLAAAAMVIFLTRLIAGGLVGPDTLSAALGAAAFSILFLAYRRGWEAARYFMIAIVTALIGLATPEPFVSQYMPFIVVLPPLVAQVLAGPGWVLVSAAGVFFLLLARAGWQGVYTNPETIVIYGMGIGGMLAARSVIESALRQTREERQRGEASFRLLFSHNPIPMWVYDQETLRFLEVNDAAVERYRYSREEFLAMRITDIRPAEDVPRLLENVRSPRPELQHSGRWRHRWKDGTVRDVEISSHRLRFQGRESSLVVALDITERLQAEADRAAIASQNARLLERERELRQAAEISEEKYRELFENANDIVYSADLEGNITSINREGERLTEYTQKELLGRNMAEFIAKEFLDRSKAMLRAKAEGSTKTTYEIDLITKSGRRLPLEVSSRLISLGGKPAGVQGIARDITERKKAEQELRARESRLASIYETVADVIFVLGVEEGGGYRFTSVNPAFRAVTGLPPEAVVGKLISEVIPQPSLDLVLAKYREAIEGKRTVRWEETSDYPTGRLTGEVSVAPIFDAGGDCVLLVGAVHDISERKRAEAEIAELNEALERKVVERTRQLEDANRELAAFSYSVSHDLRAPLRTIGGFAQILLDSEAGNLSEEGRRYLGLVREGAARMGDLIEDLLRLSHLGRAALEPRLIDTAAMVADVIRSLDGECAGRKVDFAIGDLPACYADARLIRQVWLNLIANALKFTRGRDPARVTIESTTADKQVVYSVRDNGVGFDARYADKLFGVFQRLHRAEEYEGTGLGLAIVQRIVLRHGGWVRAEAKAGEGACFSFSLGALPWPAALEEGTTVEAG